MKNGFRLFAMALLLWAVQADATTVHPAPIRVTEAQFGIFHNDEQAMRFEASDHIVLSERPDYGWYVHLSRKHARITVREEFTLPAKPETWGAWQKGRRISHHGKTCNTTNTIRVKDGYLSNSWSPAPGDPSGPYQIRVFINKRLIKTFHFEAE